MTIWASVPRLFLRTCRWVLGRMPFNNHCNLLLSPFPPNMSTKLNKHKLQGVCSSSSSTDGSWRWWRWRRRRRRRNLIILVVVAVLVCFLLGSLWGISYDHSRVSKRRVDKVAAADMWWDQKSRILQEQFNLSSSKDQLISMATLYFMTSHQKAYLACIDERGLGVPLNNGIQCALEQLSSDRQKFELWRNWLTENIEGRYQCPVRNNFIPETLETSSVKEEHAPTVQSQNTMVSSLNADQHSVSLSVCFLKTCWCVIFFIVVSWKVSVLYEGIRINLKWEHVQNKKRHLQSFYKCGGKWRRKLLILFLLSGVIGSTWLFWFMNKNTILWRTEMLANMCDERARMLQDQFNVSMNHVHALAILVSTFHHGKHPSAIDQRTFAEYTEVTAFERPLTSGVAYALKVVHSERAKFEKIHGWTIKKMVEADHSAIHDYIPEKLDPSPIQEEYAPVIFSQETVSHIVSIDMMSGKEDRENILRARASGKGVLTPPFKLLKSNHLGVVLTFAVYNTKLSADATPEQRIEATEGYLGASYDVPSLVEKLLHQLASKQTIVVNVFDITNISAPINMYGPNVTNTGPLHISDLHFGDPHRRHEMHCRFKQKPPPPWTAIMASTGILVITLLLGHIFHAAINRIAKVEGDYREMMELKIRAEAADVAKSQFLATVSHEIRTPMNGVLGMLQMLMDTELNANQFDYAQTAHSSGKDLISLINEVLDQAKIESGRLELEAVLFDPRSVLDNVLSLFSGKSHDKGIELAGYVSDSVPEAVIGDPGRFRQIITNLVGNSVKFTVEGHIFVSIYLAEEVRNPLEVKDEMCRHQLKLARNGVDRSYNTLSGLPVVDRWKSWQNFQTLSGGFITGACEIISLLVTVEDTGVGILRDAQSRIFMPFMQADSSTSRTYGGTGIGLSISKCLVDMMGGEIGFVSEPGMGSTFSFAVAFRKAETNSLKTKQHQFQSPVSEFCGMRALVVDGTSIRAEVTKYHLRRLGIYVDIVSSPKSLWSHVSNLRCSSGKLCVNMVLIEKDGWDQETTLSLPRVLNEFCQNVREVYSESCLKIFLLATSSSSELDRFKSSSCMDDVIMKPLRLSMLITCFQQILGAGAKKYQNKVKPPFLQSLLSGKHILVVDDNIVNRRVAEGALIKYGAKVTCVESGKAAIELLWPPHKFDACFMDLQMPEMDGFEATRQIRCIENELNNFILLGEASNEIFGNVVHWHTPILAMTADVIQATHEKCITCGMDGYVSKPFEEQQLYTAVLQFFENGQ